jgi:hypothetical protein
VWCANKQQAREMMDRLFFFGQPSAFALSIRELSPGRTRRETDP